MYSPQIDSDQVRKLYMLKCAINSSGEKTTMTKLVKEAVGKYLLEKEKELKEKQITEKQI